MHRIVGSPVGTTEIEPEIDTRQVTLALLSPGFVASDMCCAEQPVRYHRQATQCALGFTIPLATVRTRHMQYWSR